MKQILRRIKLAKLTQEELDNPIYIQEIEFKLKTFPPKKESTGWLQW